MSKTFTNSGKEVMCEKCTNKENTQVAGVSKSLPPVAYTKAIGENTSIDLFHLDQKVI